MSNTIQIKRRTSGSGALGSLAVGELGVDLTDSNKLYVGTSGGNQLLNPTASGTLTSTGDFTIDSGDGIILDADGGAISLKDGGTRFGILENSSSNFVIQNPIDDKDILFKIKDGGTTKTALTLDGSEDGNATFSGTVTASGGTLTGGLTINAGNASLKLNDTSSGSLFWIFSNGNELRMAVDGASFPSAYLNLTTGGNLGLGVTGASERLEVAGNAIASGYVRSENITYAADQDVAYLIAGTSGWTGATTNWNTYGFQHRIKTNSGGVPRVTIDRAGGEAFSVDNSSNVVVGNDLKAYGTATVGVSVNAAGLVVKRLNGGDPFIQFNKGSTRHAYIQSYQNKLYVSNDNASDIFFRTQNSDNLILYHGGTLFSNKGGDLGTSASRWSTIYGSAGNFSGGSDANLRLRSDSNRSGIFIDKPGTTSIMGSALVLASDESYRLGTASYYHVVCQQGGGTLLQYQGNTKLTTNSSGVEIGNDGNTDYALIGPTKIGGGFGHGDYAGFSHRDRSTTTSYALLQHTGGTTYLNSNIRIYMGVNNANYTAQVESDRFQVNNALKLNDNSKIKLGNSDDLQIFHDGSHSYVSDVGTGHLRLTGTNVLIEDGAGTDYIYAASNAVTLYNAGNIRLQTNSTGVSVTGDLTVSGTISGSAASLTNIDADTFQSQANSQFLRKLSQGSEANIDTYTDIGVRQISYTGHSRHLMTLNLGGSPGTAQFEWHYTSQYRFRQKVDNNNWSAWRYIVSTTADQSNISGTLWHSGNDGASSGLDADLLDGQHGSHYLDAGNLNSGRVPVARMNLVLPTSGNYTWSAATTAGNYTTGLQTAFVRSNEGWPNYGSVLHVGARGGTDAGGDFQIYCGHGSAHGGNYLRVRNADNSANPTDSWTDWRTIWDSGNDGSGSGLDADKLDGLQATSFLRSDADDTVSKQLTFPSGVGDRPILQGGFYSRLTGDGDSDIWGISETFYPSHSTNGNAWGIRWSSSPNEIQFVGNGSNKFRIDLDTAGKVYYDDNELFTVAGGTLTGQLQITENGNGAKVSSKFSNTSTATGAFQEIQGWSGAGYWRLGVANENYSSSVWRKTTWLYSHGGSLVLGSSNTDRVWLTNTSFYPSTSGHDLGTNAQRWQLYATSGDFAGSFTINNSGTTSSTFHADVGNYNDTQVLFEHTGATTPVPFAIKKSGYSGTSRGFGILHLDMAHSTVGGGSNVHFTLRDSSGGKQEYAGIGGYILDNTSGSEDGALAFYTTVNGSHRQQKMTLDGTGATIENNLTVNGLTTSNGVRLGRDWHIANRAGIRLDSNGTAYPADILFGHTSAANQTSWSGVYWSLSSRGANHSPQNAFYFYRGSGHAAPNNSEATIMTFTPDLKVGINTTNPQTTFHSAGTIRVGTSTFTDHKASQQYSNGTYEMAIAGSGTHLNVADGSNSTAFRVTPSSKRSYFFIPASESLTDYGGLTIQEPTNSRGLSMGYDHSAGYFWMYARDVGVGSKGINLNNTLYVKSGNNNVGIGVATPFSSAGIDRFLHIGSASDDHSGIVFQNADTTKAEMWLDNGALHFWRKPSGSGDYWLTLKSNGDAHVNNGLIVGGAISLITNTTPSTAGGEAFLYKHSSNGTVLSGYNASIETGSAGSRSVALSVSNAGTVAIGGTLDVNGSGQQMASFGNTSARCGIEVKSSQWCEVFFTNASYANSARIGMAYDSSHSSGTVNGDFYVYQPNVSTMDLIVKRAGGVTLCSSGHTTTVGGSLTVTKSLLGVSNSGLSKIGNIVLDTNGEDLPVINHQLNNDLALMDAKGGTVTYGGLSSTPSATANVFRSDSTFLSIYRSDQTSSNPRISNSSNGFTITLESLPKNLSYTTRVGITFAHSGWRCGYVKIEVYRNGAWTQIKEETNNTGATVYQYYNTAQYAISKIRYTLKNPATTYLRIVSLFAFNYNSTGNSGYFLSQAGGTIYGDVIVDGGALRLANGNSLHWDNENTRILASHASQYIRFDVGGTSNVMYATPNTLSIGAGSSHAVGGTPKLYLTGQTNMIVMSQPNVFNNSSYIRHWGTAHFQWQTYNGSNAGILELEPYGGNVGVGTYGNTPNSKLFVANGELMVDYGSGGSNGGAAMRIATNSNMAFIQSNAYYNSGIKHARAMASSSIGFRTDATRGGDIVFETSPSGSADANMTLTERVTIKQNGNVAIGLGGINPSPSAKLHVNGAVSDIIAKFVDGSDGVDIATRGSNRQQIDFLGSNTSAINAKGSLRINYDSDNNGTNDSIVFGRNGADESGTADLVLNEGSVGIGGTPSSPLTLHMTGGSYGSDATSGFIISNTSSGRATQRIRTVNNNAAELFFDVNGAARWDFSCRKSTYDYKLHLYKQASTPSYTAVSFPTMTWTQTGRVGIMDDDPGYELEVQGSISNYGDGKIIRLRSNDYIIGQIENRGTGADYDKGYFRLFDGGTAMVVLDSAGDSYLAGGSLGIGTAVSSAKLHIAGSQLGQTLNDYQRHLQIQAGLDGNTGHLEVKDVRTAAGNTWTTSGRRLQMKIDSTYMGYIQWNGTGNNYGMSFGTGATTSHPGNVTEAMRIDSSQRVGIGVAPSAKLHVYQGDCSAPTDSNTHVVIEDSDHSYLGIYGGSSSDVGIHFGDSAIDARIKYENDNRKLKFAATGTTDLMTLDSTGLEVAGNLNLETSGGDVGLWLHRTDAREYRLYVDSNGLLNLRDQDAGANRILVAADGDVDIFQRVGIGGNHSNVYKLLVNGSSRFDDSMYFSSVGQITWSASEFKLRGESGKGLSLGAGGSFGHVVINTDGDTDIAQRLGVGGAHSGSYGLYVHGTSYFGNNIYGADADYLAVFGRARVGYIGWSDYAGFAHRDQSTTTTYALLQGSSGDTFLNSANGQTIYFRQGNNNAGGIVSGNWGLGTISPGSYKLYVNGTSYFTSAGTFQNNGSGANDHSELNIFKNTGDNTSSAILRVGYDSNSAFVISRQRASSSIYLNSAQSGSTVYHQVNEDTIFTVDGSNVLFYKSAEFDGGIKDKDGQLGSSGQVLKSTGSDVDWDTFDWEDLPNISTLDALP